MIDDAHPLIDGRYTVYKIEIRKCGCCCFWQERQEMVKYTCEGSFFENTNQVWVS